MRGTRALSSSPSAIHDVIDFPSALPALKERKHISHVFRLSCSCLTNQAPSLPTVSFGNISTSNLSRRSIDVILTVQSLSTLCLDFGETGLDPSYDPWQSVDYFGRSKIHKKLSASYKRLLERRSSPRQVRARPIGGTSSELSPLRASRRIRQNQCFGSVSKSEITRSVRGLRQGSSNE